MNYRFHITVHARPPDVEAGATHEFLGTPLTTLAVLPRHMQTPFAVTFEEVLAQFERLPRMFCEPDGSFVWVGSLPLGNWQIDGNLLDRDGRLMFVDLRGISPALEFDRLLAALGWPEVPLMFQMVREAVFLAEPEFRRAAAAAALVC